MTVEKTAPSTCLKGFGFEGASRKNSLGLPSTQGAMPWILPERTLRLCYLLLLLLLLLQLGISGVFFGLVIDSLARRCKVWQAQIQDPRSPGCTCPEAKTMRALGLGICCFVLEEAKRPLVVRKLPHVPPLSDEQLRRKLVSG